MKVKNCFGNIKRCNFRARIFDEQDTTIVTYVSPFVDVPKGDSFAVRMVMKNHALTERPYKLTMTVGNWQFGEDVRNYDWEPSAFLSFYVKYADHDKTIEYANANWSRSWGAVCHRDADAKVEIIGG